MLILIMSYFKAKIFWLQKSGLCTFQNIKKWKEIRYKFKMLQLSLYAVKSTAPNVHLTHCSKYVKIRTLRRMIKDKKHWMKLKTAVTFILRRSALYSHAHNILAPKHGKIMMTNTALWSVFIWLPRCRLRHQISETN